MKPVFTNMSMDEIMCREKLKKVFNLPCIESAEQEGWAKYGAGFMFWTRDNEGTWFAINADRHYVTKAGRPLWNGKKWLGWNVQMPKPAYDYGCKFQVIFNEDYTACVLAQSDTMTENNYGAMETTIFENKDMEI